MRKYIALFGLSFVLFFVVSSCDKELFKLGTNSGYDYVRYGTSFGECLGYCNKNIEISEAGIDYKASGWDIDGNLPDIKQSSTIDSSEWVSLVEHIDFQKFTALNSVIGCPDCADGGAEWIEIMKNDIVYKVTFEYSNEPDEVSAYIEILRSFMDGFE